MLNSGCVTLLLVLIYIGFASPNMMMAHNDYASLSSGYSASVLSAAWNDSFLQSSYSEPWHKQQVCAVSIVTSRLSTSNLVH